MRVRLFTCFIVVFCTQAISSLGLHGNFSSEQRGLNSSKRNNMQTKQPIRNYGSIKEAIADEESNKEEKYKLSYVSIKKAQRGGRGANGGGNVNYRPHRTVNSAPSLLPWISTVCVSLILIFVFSFHAKVL